MDEAVGVVPEKQPQFFLGLFKSCFGRARSRGGGFLLFKQKILGCALRYAKNVTRIRLLRDAVMSGSSLSLANGHRTRSCISS